MNYDIYVMGTSADNRVYGYAVSYKNTIQWLYNMDTSNIDTYKSMATASILSEIKDFVENNIDSIKNLSYPFTTKDEMVDILAYGVKSVEQSTKKKRTTRIKPIRTSQSQRNFTR